MSMMCHQRIETALNTVIFFTLEFPLDWGFPPPDTHLYTVIPLWVFQSKFFIIIILMKVREKPGRPHLDQLSCSYPPINLPLVDCQHPIRTVVTYLQCPRTLHDCGCPGGAVNIFYKQFIV